MRFRLDAQHYADDKLLEAGMEVGDGENSVSPWRYERDIKEKDIKAGQLRPPSLQMTPLDDEARKVYRDTFNTDTPERDPTKPIPLQGTGSKAMVPPKVDPKTAPKPTPPDLAKTAQHQTPANSPRGTAGSQAVKPPTNEAFKHIEPEPKKG